MRRYFVDRRWLFKQPGGFLKNTVSLGRCVMVFKMSGSHVPNKVWYRLAAVAFVMMGLGCSGAGLPLAVQPLAAQTPAAQTPMLSQAPVAGPARAVPSGVEPLRIVSASGSHLFQVEVMRTMDERARGLMFRRYLPQDRGMLFDFAVEAQVAMWMKDTFIPLDMIFIRKDGTISQIVENTEPHSTRTIASQESVYSVLEVNAGVAARLGFKAGDRVDHPLFAAAKR